MTISRHERLELYHLSLAFLLSAELEVFGPLDGALVLPLAARTLHPQHQLLRGLGLLPQDGFGLTSKTLLLSVVPRLGQVIPPFRLLLDIYRCALPASPLGLLGLGGLLVLRHLHLYVLVALGAE